jgi:PAS domain S-box-containing protein
MSSSKSTFSSLLKNYFLYLSVFTIEIIVVVAYFTWKNREMLVNSAVVDKLNISQKYPREYEEFLDAYNATVGHYYLMAGIVIFSVIALSALIHILMKKRIKDIERLKYLETITKDSEQIMKSEAKYRSLFENNGTAILIIGDDELISDCNSKFVQLLGYSDKSELIDTMHWEKMVCDEDIIRVKEYDRLRREDPEKAPSEYTMKMITKSGAIKHVIVTVIVTHGTEQLASIVDITEIVEKDAALKEQEQILSQAQEIASLGSWSYYPEKNGELAISKEFAKIINISDEDAENLNLDKLKRKYEFDQFCIEVDKAYRENSTADKEITYLDRRKDGNDRTIYLKLMAKLVSDNDGSAKMIGIIQNISDIKQIENEIKRTNRDMKNLIYVTTHDLQAPLVSIEGFSNLVLRSAEKGGVSTETAEYLERIIFNVRNMSSLFRNFFEVTRINTSRNPFEHINTVELIEDAIKEKKMMCDRYGASITVLKSEEIPDIFADRENIRLLYHHLLSNAIIYSGKKIEAGYDPGKGFFVRDNGEGIEEDNIERIFLPGEKLNQDKTSGRGMGLAFCRKTIDMHNGEIYAESEGNNKGTTVYFTLSMELIRD